MKLKPDQKLYIYSMGKRFRVTAIFHDDDSANRFMERNRDSAVIAAIDPYIFIADKHDNGQPA